MCPGAPFLIGGTADAIAERLHAVVDACSVAVSRLTGAEALLLITSAKGSVDHPDYPVWREFAPGAIISTSPVRRSDLPDESSVALASGGASALPVATLPSPAVMTCSVGTMVGATLLATRSPGGEANGHPLQPWRPPITVIEITGDPEKVAEMLVERVHSTERIALLVIADGSACHGDDAPGRRDDRAASFDAALAEALAAGDPDALRTAAADRDLGRALQASIDPLAVLGLLTMQRPPTTADLLFAGAPLGVGYLVASWRWAAG